MFLLDGIFESHMGENSESNSDTEGTIVEEKERSMRGTTARVTAEVEDDGVLSDEKREKLAVALLEQGQNTDYANWDNIHPEPTVGNREL